MRHRLRWILVATGVASLCLLVGLLFSNFVGGETKIERSIQRLYALEDSRFTRELGVLLGPPFLQGTKIRALLNHYCPVNSEPIARKANANAGLRRFLGVHDLNSRKKRAPKIEGFS